MMKEGTTTVAKLSELREAIALLHLAIIGLRETASRSDSEIGPENLEPLVSQAAQTETLAAELLDVIEQEDPKAVA